MITSRHKVVLLDHNNTLVETLAPKRKEHKFIAKKYYGINLTDEKITEHWGEPYDQIVQNLYQTSDIGQAKEHRNRRHTQFDTEVYEGTVATLERIKASGRYVGVVSATLRESFEHDLTILGIKPDFLDFIQTQEATNHHKPDGRVFEPTLEWLQGFGIAADEVIYIGDSLRDLEAAQAVGFDFLGVETGLNTAKDFKNAGTESVPSITDIF